MCTGLFWLLCVYSPGENRLLNFFVFGGQHGVRQFFYMESTGYRTLRGDAFHPPPPPPPRQERQSSGNKGYPNPILRDNLEISQCTLLNMTVKVITAPGAIIGNGDRKSWDPRGPMIWDNFSIFEQIAPS